MGLRDKLKKKTPLKTWVQFQGMRIQIEYMDFPEMMSLREQFRIDPDSLLPGEAPQEFDERGFEKALAKKITELRGCTLRTLLALTNYEEPAGANLDEEYGPDEDTILFMFEEVSGFKKKILDSVTEISTFRQKQLDGEIKNSDASQGNALA